MSKQPWSKCKTEDLYQLQRFLEVVANLREDDYDGSRPGRAETVLRQLRIMASVINKGADILTKASEERSKRAMQDFEDGRYYTLDTDSMKLVPNSDWPEDGDGPEDYPALTS